jgi:hypothetical protein
MDASLQFSCTRRQFGEPTLRIAWHPGKLCTPVTRYESLRLKLVQSKVCNKLREQTSSTQITGDSKLNPARAYYRARRRKTNATHRPGGIRRTQLWPALRSDRRRAAVRRANRHDPVAVVDGGHLALPLAHPEPRKRAIRKRT